MRLASVAYGVAISAATVAVAWIWTACETPLSPTYQLTEPRVMAIRSEPVYLLPDSSVSLDTLIYLPPGSPAPTYQWSWCPTLNATEQCTLDAGALAVLLDDAGAGANGGITLHYALGSNPTAVFAYPVDPSFIQALCSRRRTTATDGGANDAGDAGMVADAGTGAANDAATAPDGAVIVPSGVGGLVCANGSWTVNVLLTVTVGGQTLQAVRQVTAYLTTPTSLNANPTIFALSPYGNPPTDAGDAGPLGSPGELVDGSFFDAGVGSIDGGAILVAAEIPVSSAQLYAEAVRTRSGVDASTVCSADAAVSDGSVHDASTDVGCTAPVGRVYESLTLAWYVESGQLGQATTTLPSVAFGHPQDWSALLRNYWVPPTTAGSPKLILVLRDNRGGVGWLTQAGRAPLP